MLLTATQLEQYRRDGFLILPGLFSAAEVQVLKDDLPRLHAEDTPANFREKNGLVRTAMGLHLRSAVYSNVVRHPRLVEPAMQILGDDKLYVQQVKVNGKEAFGGDVWQWHYDFATHHREDGAPKPLALNLHIFLDEVSEFNGPLWFVRGSHTPWTGADGAGHRDDQLSALGGGQPDRGGADPRRRHRFRQGSAGNGTDLRRQPGAWLAGQHVALAAADFLADPESGRKCADAAEAAGLSASQRPDAGDAAKR